MSRQLPTSGLTVIAPGWGDPIGFKYSEHENGRKNYDWLGLGGSVVVVTGAASGIGKAVAQGFSEVGVSVAMLDRDGEACRAAAKEMGSRVFALECDVTDREAVSEAAERVEREFGAPDILVNNAGIMRAGQLTDLPAEVWEQVLAVNLTGYLNCTRAFSKSMRARRNGVLIHVGF